MALHMGHDDMQSYKVSPHGMKINKEFCQSVRKSRQCYQEYLQEKKKQKK